MFISIKALCLCSVFSLMLFLSTSSGAVKPSPLGEEDSPFQPLPPSSHKKHREINKKPLEQGENSHFVIFDSSQEENLTYQPISEVMKNEIEIKFDKLKTIYSIEKTIVLQDRLNELMKCTELQEEDRREKNLLENILKDREEREPSLNRSVTRRSSFLRKLWEKIIKL